MQKRRIQVYDSMGETEYGETYLNAILWYIQDEHQYKKKSPLPNPENWELVPCDLETCPQQLNKCDCGVFTCMFADFLSKDLPLDFSQEHILHCRKRIVLSIVDKEFFRKEEKIIAANK
jgi:Ulp1 family protease